MILKPFGSLIALSGSSFYIGSCYSAVLPAVTTVVDRMYQQHVPDLVYYSQTGLDIMQVIAR